MLWVEVAGCHVLPWEDCVAVEMMLNDIKIDVMRKKTLKSFGG